MESLFDAPAAIEALKAATMHIADTSRVDVDLVEVADSLADIMYVCEGSALAHGFDLQSVIDVVHSANMKKIGGPVVNGKKLKPAGWQSPDIASELKRQANE